ncbi:hypothetical protein MKX03_012455 [Papaver bracteatum]|nr:hypothetical protein MKX03_012455 [Papaver bracteatum]
MNTEGVLSSPLQAQTAQLKYVHELAVSGEEPPPKYIQKDIVNVMGKQVTEVDSLSLPIIDISRFTPDASIEEKEEEMEKLKSALSSWGMFQAIGHNIPQNLLDNVYKVSKQFFHLPLEEKQKYSVSKDHENSDFQGFGSDSFKPDIDIDDGMVLDWNDFLSLLIEPVEDRNLRYWPGDDFRRTLDEYSVQTRSE